MGGVGGGGIRLRDGRVTHGRGIAHWVGWLDAGAIGVRKELVVKVMRVAG